MARALRQTLRLGRLVDAILSDAAAIERGTLEVHVAPFDLAVFTREVVEDFRLAAPSQRLEYHGPGDGVRVTSDPDRVHQILISLIDNAMKYSGRQHVVTVEVEASESRVRVRVIDQGIGIPAAEQASVFGKFYRGSNVPSAASGLGVGLYLARGLALRLHGTLTVASEVGRGSAFSLVLPKHWPEGKGAAAPSPRGNQDESRPPH
nr:HAMP domain-containing sensor histidine kinase [Polyangium spumosum]